MRVAAAPAPPPSARAPSAKPIEVPPERTRVTREQIRDAIGRAYASLNGRPASSSTLEILTAQACLETGSGESMYNYNFGGVKGAGPTGLTARCRTREVLGGKEVEIRDGFRAYRSLDEGAADYVALLRARFGAALEAAEGGDVRGFAHELKKSGYFTAREEDYAAGLLALSGQAGSAARADPSTPPARELPSVDEWSRMLDAMSANSAALIAAPLDTDSDAGGRPM
jgi:hypothetical protein